MEQLASMVGEKWWQKDSSERFWLEATDRTDIGADLHAPELDEGGKANWRYTLFKEATPGDIVFHYDKNDGANGIVGFSVIEGDWQPRLVTWAARGTYSRNKGTTPHERPGFEVPLRGFQHLLRKLGLDQIRHRSQDLRDIVASLQDIHGKGPLYFPFELSDKRPTRLLQGYAFKLPRAFVSLFLELRVALDENSTLERKAASKSRNAPWARDELILALELYLRNRSSPPGKNSQEVAELSKVLNVLGARIGGLRDSRYRNPNGVYMKMMNFRRFDPEYTASGKVGLTRGNKDDEKVWNEFAGDLERLSRVAEAIRSTLTDAAVELLPSVDGYDGVEAEEGRVLTRLHRTRERSRKLVEKRKAKALTQNGCLRCEACGFDFEQAYGERGKGFIEAHHTKPVHELAEGSKTKLEDLVLVCANYHRMIHSARPWLTIRELQQLLEGD